MNKCQQDNSGNELRLGSFSNERWAKEMDASEWMVRKIISRLNKGRGASYQEIAKELDLILRTIIAKQNEEPHFYFNLGSLKLREWLEFEAETERMDVFWEEDEPIYKLSGFISNLLRRKQTEIDELISAMTGDIY